MHKAFIHICEHIHELIDDAMNSASVLYAWCNKLSERWTLTPVKAQNCRDATFSSLG